MSEKYEPGQYVPIEEYQETISGGPTPTGTASNTWPNYQFQVAPAPYRHCPTCTCGQQHYSPYYSPWTPPWIVYTT